MKPLMYFIFLLSFFCSTFSFAKVKVKVRSDAEVLSIKSGDRKTLKARDEFTLDEPTWVVEKERVPVLIFPVSKDAVSIELNSPSTRRDGKEFSALSVDQQLSDLLKQFVEIQKLVQTKNKEEALNKAYALKSKYPDVAFLNFLLASVLVVNGNKSDAERALERGLASHPEFQDGKVMLQKLRGAN